MRTHRAIIVGILLLIGTNTFAQQPTPKKQQSHKYRTILTLAGGGGGFTLGVFGGLAAFDDATNSDRKVWTTAIVSAAGGAVAGYFLGRSLDRRSGKINVTRASDDFYQRLTGTQSFSRTQPLGLYQRASGLLPLPPYSSLAVLPTGAGGFTSASATSTGHLPLEE